MKSSFNFSVKNLHAVHGLQVELGELKGRLTEVISNCDAICRRINAEGPESLRSSVKPFSEASAELEASSSLPSQGSTLKTSPFPSNLPT